MSSKTKEFQIGATGRFSLITRDRPGGDRVAPDSAPTILRMFVDGTPVDPTEAVYANTVAQKNDSASTPITGTYAHTFDTSSFNRLTEVEFTYQTVIDGITREVNTSATFRDDPAQVPEFEAV